MIYYLAYVATRLALNALRLLLFVGMFRRLGIT